MSVFRDLKNIFETRKMPNVCDTCERKGKKSCPNVQKGKIIWCRYHDSDLAWGGLGQ